MAAPRRRSAGRPQQHRPGTVALTIRLPAEIYDAFCRVSVAGDVPMTRLIVQALSDADPQRYVVFPR